jgi:hypothetical protein
VDKPFTGSVDQPRVDILTSSSYCASWFHIFHDRGCNFRCF